MLALLSDLPTEPPSGLVTAASKPVAAASGEATSQPPKDDEPDLDVLTFHRTNYFVTGFTRETQVKFQFSFKYDLWPSTGHHTVYLAYTQKSLWDLYDRSQPFRESNYAPEIFYAHYHSNQHGKVELGCGVLSEQLGLEHESNGEGGEVSRSWNRLFGEVQATCQGHLFYGELRLRLWYPFLLSENDTIVQTQGYGELGAALGVDAEALHMNGVIGVALRKGTSKSLGKGSVVADARWRPTYQRVFGNSWRFAPFLWFQLFVGYGETLGTFDRSSTSVRLGIGLTDRAR